MQVPACARVTGIGAPGEGHRDRQVDRGGVALVFAREGRFEDNGGFSCAGNPHQRADLPGRHLEIQPGRIGFTQTREGLVEQRRVVGVLVDHAVRWCRERGLDQIRLHNAADNPVASAAWESLGFRVVEHARLKHL